MKPERVLRSVKTSECAQPIVPALERNDQIRICGDFKITKSRDCAREVLHTSSGGPVYQTLWGKEVQQVGLERCIPTSRDGRSVIEAGDH